MTGPQANLLAVVLGALLLTAPGCALRMPALFHATHGPARPVDLWQPARHRKLAEGHSWEADSPCVDRNLSANAGPPNPPLCNPYGAGSKVFAVQHRHMSLISHLSSTYNGTIPRAVIVPEALHMPEVSVPYNYEWPAMIQYTSTHAPLDDGYLHVLVQDVPCAAYGCCSLHYRLRPNSTDLISLRNFMVFSEYKFMLDLVHLKPRFILDVGGVGMSAVWLASLYPNATVVRLEPHPSNYLAGVVNSLGLANVWQVNLGLWDKNIPLQACDRPTPAEPWFTEVPSFQQQGFYTREPQDPPCDIVSINRVNVATLESFMNTYSIPMFDIIKMDIEGAEARVFADANIKNVLKDTTLFVAELHDRFAPGSAALVHNTFSELGDFEHSHDDENDIWLKSSVFVKRCLGVDSA